MHSKETVITAATTPPSPILAFSGLRVFDASQGLAGPYCAMLLAQHGATVIKLEPPQGDWSRGIGSRFGDQSPLSISCNRGKHSLVIDLKQPGATQAVQRAASQCDVVLEGFRPGVAARLGLDYTELAAKRPGLIYASISGYGQDGPYSERPATDTVIQAFSGMMALNRDVEGRPSRVGFLVVDMTTGLYAFQAVSAALYARLRGGPGQRLDISLMQAAAALMSQRVVEMGLEGGEPQVFNAPAGVYRSSDAWVAIALSNEDQFTALCTALERPDLRADPRYANFVERARHLAPLIEAVSQTFLTRDTATWVQRINAAGGLANPVLNLSQWSQDPHVQAVRAAPVTHWAPVGDFPLPRIPGAAEPLAGDPRADWPTLGAAGAQSLEVLGFSADEIEDLRQRKILIEP
jgi:crotonobetainyl-CoA:carnitine CoA-transferase CaiB-like acyl-CoA transferase